MSACAYVPNARKYICKCLEDSKHTHCRRALCLRSLRNDTTSTMCTNAATTTTEHRFQPTCHIHIIYIIFLYISNGS